MRRYRVLVFIDPSGPSYWVDGNSVDEIKGGSTLDAGSDSDVFVRDVAGSEGFLITKSMTSVPFRRILRDSVLDYELVRD